jgi:hypothetical protein
MAAYPATTDTQGAQLADKYQLHIFMNRSGINMVTGIVSILTEKHRCGLCVSVVKYFP